MLLHIIFVEESPQTVSELIRLASLLMYSILLIFSETVTVTVTVTEAFVFIIIIIITEIFRVA